MRAARPGDRTFLEALHAEKRREEVGTWGFTPQQQAAFLAAQYVAFRHSLAGLPGLREWVLTEGEVDRGYLAVAELDGELRVIELEVALAARRRGIARRALQALLEEADARRRPASLHVDHGNPALKLYAQLGFEAVGTDALGITMRRTPR